MDTAIAIFSDIIILVFNLSLYIRLTPLKKDTPLYKGILYTAILVSTGLYMVCSYVFHVPYALASLLCMSIPSFILLLVLCKYKGSRFLVTFCFVDTVTFIIAAFAKFAQVLSGLAGGVVSMAVMLVLCVLTYLSLRPYCPRYRELLEQVPKGWTPMAVSAVFNYILLTIASAYPKPMMERMEYLPVYAFLCVTILVFYVVFIVQILQKAQLTKANQLLQQQQHWHKLAYMDPLTGLANAASYASRTQELEQQDSRDSDYYLLIFDIDDFKHVNDTYGHPAGNEVLKNTAAFFLSSFPPEHFEFFRVGGDEFAAIVSGMTDAQVRDAVEKINTMPLDRKPGCTYSCGSAQVDFSGDQAFHQALGQADRAMYEAKSRKKSNK